MTPEDYIKRNTNHTRPQLAFMGNIFWTHKTSQKYALGHPHDKQLAIPPMLTLYELFFSSYPDQKKSQIYLDKNKVTIFWLDIVRIIKTELLFCCINMRLSILLGYAEVWEVSEEQHSWHFQNTIKVQTLKAQADSSELYWTGQQCSLSAEITPEQSSLELHPKSAANFHSCFPPQCIVPIHYLPQLAYNWGS